MTNERLIEAISEVGKELRYLPQEEFERELECHKDGDIAQILLETNALCIQN
jgi:hypothetical protein